MALDAPRFRVGALRDSSFGKRSQLRKSLDSWPRGVSVLCAKLFSCVQLFATLWTIAQAPLSMGFSKARILEWVAISSSRGSSPPRDQTRVSSISCTGKWVLYHPTHQGSLSNMGLPLGVNSPVLELPTHTGRCPGAGQHTGTPAGRPLLPPPFLCLPHPALPHRR